MKFIFILLSIFMMSCSTSKLPQSETDRFETFRSIDTVYSYLGNGTVIPQIQLGLIPMKVRVETFNYHHQKRDLQLIGIIQDGQTGEAIRRADIFIGRVVMGRDTGSIVSTSNTHTDDNGRFSIHAHITGSDHFYVGALGYLVASYEINRMINAGD